MATQVHKSYIEYFDECGPKIKKENMEQTRIKSTSNTGISTAYGYQEILSTSTGIYSWNLKIDSGGNGVMVVGISTSNEDINRAFYKNTDIANYGYNLFSGFKVSCGKFDTYGKKAKTNDYIKTILDLDAGTISYNINGIKQGIAHHIQQNEFIKYRYCVSIQDHNDMVTLTDFSIKNERNKTNNQNNNININHNKELELLKENNCHLMMKISMLESDAIESKEKINNLEKENNELKRKINLLQDERKEFEIKINELQEKKAIDITMFKQWNERDVLNWIFSINNGLFLKYEKELRCEIIECEIKGIDLLKIKRKDIQDFGVKTFAHQKILQDNIDILIEINKNDNVQQYCEGYNIVDTLKSD